MGSEEDREKSLTPFRFRVASFPEEGARMGSEEDRKKSLTPADGKSEGGEENEGPQIVSQLGGKDRKVINMNLHVP